MNGLLVFLIAYEEAGASLGALRRQSDDHRNLEKESGGRSLQRRVGQRGGPGAPRGTREESQQDPRPSRGLRPHSAPVPPETLANSGRRRVSAERSQETTQRPARGHLLFHPLRLFQTCDLSGSTEYKQTSGPRRCSAPLSVRTQRGDLTWSCNPRSELSLRCASCLLPSPPRIPSPAPQEHRHD